MLRVYAVSTLCCSCVLVSQTHLGAEILQGYRRAFSFYLAPDISAVCHFECSMQEREYPWPDQITNYFRRWARYFRQPRYRPQNTLDADCSVIDEHIPADDAPYVDVEATGGGSTELRANGQDTPTTPGNASQRNTLTFEGLNLMLQDLHLEAGDEEGPAHRGPSHGVAVPCCCGTRAAGGGEANAAANELNGPTGPGGSEGTNPTEYCQVCANITPKSTDSDSAKMREILSRVRGRNGSWLRHGNLHQLSGESLQSVPVTELDALDQAEQDSGKHDMMQLSASGGTYRKLPMCPDETADDAECGSAAAVEQCNAVPPLEAPRTEGGKNM
jgi:hypothetical protein